MCVSDFKSCPFTNRPITDNIQSSIQQKYRLYRYSIEINSIRIQVNICNKLYRLLRNSDPELKKSQEEYLANRSIIIGELVKNDFKLLREKVLHWECEGFYDENKHIDLKELIKSVLNKNLVPKTKNDKKNNLIRELCHLHKFDGQKIEVGFNSYLWAICYFRDYKEFQFYLEQLEKEDLIEVLEKENENISIQFTFKGLSLLEKSKNTTSPLVEKPSKKTTSLGRERRFAILVGSNNYKKSEDKLNFSLKDVDAMKEVLVKRCCFKEDDIIDLKFDTLGNNSLSEKEVIFNAFGEISNSIKKEHTLLFYYSGHGIYEKNENKSYLEISDDCKISIQNIFKRMKELSPKQGYLIIDACHSGSEIFLVPKNTSKKIRKLSFNSHGFHCLFGAEKDGKAFEPTTGNIKNSLMTHCFIGALNDTTRYLEGTLSINGIMEYVTHETSKISNFKQILAMESQACGRHPLGVCENYSSTSNIK